MLIYFASPLKGSIAVLVLVTITVALILSWLNQMQRRLAFERIQAIDQSRIALLRYVQLRHHCSEEAAYRRIANFVKKHVSLEDQVYIESMAVYDRQGLLTYAQNILAQNPDRIDEI